MFARAFWDKIWLGVYGHRAVDHYTGVIVNSFRGYVIVEVLRSSLFFALVTLR